MKRTFFILGLFASSFSFAQDQCKFEVTDDLNDHPLQVQFTCKPEVFSFSIYDRWGKEIYKTDNPDFMWDEKNKSGEKVEQGTYIYALNCTFKDEEPKKFTGNFTIVR